MWRESDAVRMGMVCSEGKGSNVIPARARLARSEQVGPRGLLADRLDLDEQRDVVGRGVRREAEAELAALDGRGEVAAADLALELPVLVAVEPDRPQRHRLRLAEERQRSA